MKVVTDGWWVYPGFIPDGDLIVSKTYMTRVEGENTRQRHSAAFFIRAVATSLMTSLKQISQMLCLWLNLHKKQFDTFLKCRIH
jgi:IS1 family transposase